MKIQLVTTVLVLTLLSVSSCNDHNNPFSKKEDKETSGKGQNPEVNETPDKGFSIAGKWKVVNVDDMKDIDEADKKMVLETATIEFTPDGSYISKSSDKSELGSYTYNEREKTIVAISQEGKEERFTIEVLGKNKISMTLDDSGTVILERQ